MIRGIVIVGGGPAGAYLGYLLAKNGKKPIIFDHSHPREKPCGGGISVLAIEKFPFLNEIPEKKVPEHEIELISPDGISVMTAGKKSSWTLSRLILDKFILDKAIEQGCKIIKEQVIDIKLKDTVWNIKTKKAVYKTKLVIGADGANSIVRRRIAGAIPKQDTGICYGCFAKSNKKEKSRVKYFKNKQGYAWCFPRHDHLSIGVGMGTSKSIKIKEVLDDFISEYYPDIEIQSKWGAKIPNIKNENFFDLPCSGDNWLLIGDAAGHVDSLTGEGITYALWSAELAAKAIIDHNPSSFDKLWRQEYGGRLIDSCKIRKFFYNPRLLEYSIRLASRSKSFSNLLYKMMTNQQDSQDFLKLIPFALPKIIKEYIGSKL